jgi:hypothetical protein
LALDSSSESKGLEVKEAGGFTELCLVGLLFAGDFLNPNILTMSKTCERQLDS